MNPFALWADDEDELDRAIDGAEPARRRCRELDHFARGDEVLGICEQQARSSWSSGGRDGLAPPVDPAAPRRRRLRGREGAATMNHERQQARIRDSSRAGDAAPRVTAD